MIRYKEFYPFKAEGVLYATTLIFYLSLSLACPSHGSYPGLHGRKKGTTLGIWRIRCVSVHESNGLILNILHGFVYYEELCVIKSLLWVDQISVTISVFLFNDTLKNR